MSEVSTIQLFNIRSHEQASFEFKSGMNAIVGPNGSGKTTVLESLYCLMQGSSFRGSISELCRYDSQHCRIVADFIGEHTTHQRNLSYSQKDGIIQKKWMIDSKNYGRLPSAQRIPVVLFEPDIARLITGSPERRRQYLDHINSQLDFEAATIQNRYERVLKQRNTLLKTLSSTHTSGLREQLFVWNTQLAHLAESIVQARLRLLGTLQKDIDRHYKRLGGEDTILLTYQSTVSTESDTYGSRLLQFLETSEQRDITLGYTSFGPHRDDVEILLADQPATQRASRGEVRTVVIALKLMETDLLANRFSDQNITPILLLDDVLSELDLVHQEQVLSGFKNYQVFLTTTDAHALNAVTHTIMLD